MLGMGSPRRGKIARTMLIWTVMAVTAVTVASCTQVVKGRAVLAGPKVGQPIEWGPCRVAGGGAVKLPGGAQCGKLAVPVDYKHPGGDATTLGLIRFPATGDKVGSLVINPGGPGESGIEAALGVVQSLPQQVRERFDLVGFDPRGVAASRPAIWCNSDADNDKLRTETQADYSPAGVAQIEDETKAYVGRCVAKMGKKFLANVGTDNVARDLDTIREALGDSKLTFLGYSYGTRIGAAYAEAFPKNVRAMILDGAIDPNADPVESDLRQAKGFEVAFDNFAKDCAKSPTCPLGTDPAKAVDVYHHLVYALVDKKHPMRRQAGTHQRPPGPQLQRRHHRHDHGPVFADVLAPPDNRVDRTVAPPRRCVARVGRPLYASRQAGALQQLHRRPGRGQLCGPAAGEGSSEGHRRGPPLA